MHRIFRWTVVCIAALVLAACASGSQTADRPGHGPDPATTNAGGSPHPPPVPTVLILDASGSMTTPDAPGPRIDAAKAAAKELIATLPDKAQLGLMTYGTGTDSSDAAHDAGCRDVTTLVPLGRLDRNALDAQIDALQPSGYTPISLALEQSAGLLPSRREFAGNSAGVRR
jgi:Ca-activated chloride channel homolog